MALCVSTVTGTSDSMGMSGISIGTGVMVAFSGNATLGSGSGFCGSTVSGTLNASVIVCMVGKRTSLRPLASPSINATCTATAIKIGTVFGGDFASGLLTKYGAP